MFKYACHKAGIDFDKLKLINPGGAADIDKAFRGGTGAYVQQQGPFPQQLEADGVGHIVAQVGKQIGPVAFLKPRRDPCEWLATDTAKAFMSAPTGKRSRAYMNETPATEIAKDRKSRIFPTSTSLWLAACIETYQQPWLLGRRMSKLLSRLSRLRWMFSSTSVH